MRWTSSAFSRRSWFRRSSGKRLQRPGAFRQPLCDVWRAFVRWTTPLRSKLVSFDLLDAGERACLRLCRHERIGLFLTDDLEAREAAQKEGIRPVGSLGMVLRANREGRLTKQTARRTLEALRDQSTLFVRPALVNRVIAKLKNG